MQSNDVRVPLSKGSRDLFLSRLDKLAEKHPIAKSAGRHVGDNFLNQMNIGALVQSVENSANWGFLNDAGKRVERRKALLPAFVDFAKSRRDLKAMRETLSATLPKVKGREANDMVGELRDQEIRRLVREMPQDKRDRLDSLSPDMARAVARAPAELSGMSPSVHEQLRTKIIEAEDPRGVEAWRAAEEALQVANDALNEVEHDLYAGADFAHKGEYRQFVEQYVRPEVEKANK